MFGLRTQPSLSRDFTLLSLFIVTILLVVSVWVTVETLNTHARNVSKQLEAEALRIDRALIVEVENGSYILESLGRQIQAIGYPNTEQIAQLFFSFAKTEGMKRSHFSWTDSSQHIIISSSVGVLSKPVDVSDRDYIKKTIAEPWRVHIGKPIISRVSDRMVLPMSLGLTDTRGTYVGSVTVAQDVQSMTEELGRALRDGGVRYAITNMGLTLITQTQESEQFLNQTFDIGELAKQDLTSAESKQFKRPEYYGLGHDKTFSYFERSSKYPFLIFVGIDATYSAQAIRDALLPRLFQLAVIALFLLFILWTVRKRIIQPVMQLTHHASAIARGERYRPEALEGPLEIHQLAEEIKRLYDYIDERRRVESELRLKNAELTRIKEAAHLTNQVKADFFAYVGMELTEPTEMILEHIETIKDQLFGPIENPKYRLHAQEVHDQALQLLEMLSDIKAISDAESGLLALNDGDVDLNFILPKIVRIFRERHHLAFEVQLEIGAGLPHVRGDELRLKQMMLNILNAAARLLNPGDTIRIGSSVKSQEVALYIAFVSTVNTHAPKALGGVAFSHASRSKHGLDIAMARLLIAMHQGSLEMKTTQDRVTTISVKFPASRVI